MRRNNKGVLGKDGFTLMEVVVSITILMLTLEILILSILASARMNQRAGRMQEMENDVWKKILTKEGEEAAVSLEFAGYRIEAEGRLYTEDAGDGIRMRIVWVEDRTATASNADFDPLGEGQ